nr:DUF6778 family protein [Rhodovulum sp.]
MTQFDIRLPDSLTVSEASVYQPEADIVWRGAPRATAARRSPQSSRPPPGAPPRA